MADWKEQYLAALEARDEREKANVDLYNYCTKLADDKAQLLKTHTADRTLVEQALVPAPPAPLIGYGIRRYTSPQPVSESKVTTQLRDDLTKAQQERGDLQVKLDSTARELELLKAKMRSDTKRIAQLSANVSQLSTKVRDREEELRGKTKLVENVHDENVTLTLQLNMAEQQADRLKEENQDLVDRWMTKMGEEARKMNEAGKFE